MRRRFQARPPKKYGWLTRQIVGACSDSTVAQFQLLDASIIPTVPQQQSHVLNLQRLFVNVQVMVHTNDLEDETLAGVWGCLTWALAIIDVDDATVYDPINNDFDDELVLARGRTERIGWGTVPAISTSQSQSAAFMAQTHFDLDIKTNRRMTSDQNLVLYATRDGQVTYNRLSDHDFIVVVDSRILVKYP